MFFIDINFLDKITLLQLQSQKNRAKEIHKKANLQIDRETREQHPAEIDINFHNKIPVLQLQSQ